MAELERSALRLISFAAAAGCLEMLLPEGRLKRAADALLGLLAARLLLDIVVRLIAGE